MERRTTEELLAQILDDRKAARAEVGRTVFWFFSLAVMIGVIWWFADQAGILGSASERATPVRIVRP